jgi:hypothetical protein
MGIRASYVMGKTLDSRLPENGKPRDRISHHPVSFEHRTFNRHDGLIRPLLNTAIIVAK